MSSAVNLRVGTSGFSYDAWRGRFYPEGLAKARWLGHYAGRLGAVELNNTFYRMPRAPMCEAWSQAVGEGFRFAVKAHRIFTQSLRLRGCEEVWNDFHSAIAPLGPKLGCVFVQVPRFVPPDVELLCDFLAAAPAGVRLAMEFVDPACHCDGVETVLRDAGAALVDNDQGAAEPGGWSVQLGWGYVRLRRENYTRPQLLAWRERFAAAGWSECFVFFRHEDAARGPKLAELLQTL